LESGARDPDLIRVAMGVRGVGAQPRVHPESADLGMRAFSQPVGLNQAGHQFRGRGAGSAEELERRLVRPFVVQAVGEVILVVPLDDWTILGEQEPEPHRGGHLTVGEVMHDLSGGPLAGSGMSVKLFRRYADEGVGNDPVAVLVLRDELSAFVWLHF